MRVSAPILLAFCALPLAAQDELPKPNLEQVMQLRCSAAFAIVASEQARGAGSVNDYPPLGERGKEFFVQAGAKLMDELGLSREQLEQMLKTEVGRLQDDAMRAENPAAYVESVMQPCLLALDASGL